MMPNFNLEEAIDCPPPLIADIPPKSEGFQANYLPSGKSAKLERNARLSEAKNESVLSRWSDRVSIQSFMNAISTLSAKKQQMKLQQEQQQKNEMYDKFRQFMQQQQKLAAQQKMDRNKQDQMTQPHSLQKQHQPNTLETPMPNMTNQDTTSSCLNDSTLYLNKSILPTLTKATQANKKTKVRKVMKGGVLVTMPWHPPGGRAAEQATRGEGIPFTSNNKPTDFGNILDDILARSQESEETLIGRKKGVMSKTTDEDTPNSKVKSKNTLQKSSTSPSNIKQQTDNEGSGKQLPLSKTAEPENTFELSSSMCSENVSISDSRNIDANLNLTISMPNQSQLDSEIKHSTNEEASETELYSGERASTKNTKPHRDIENPEKDQVITPNTDVKLVSDGQSHVKRSKSSKSNIDIVSYQNVNFTNSPGEQAGNHVKNKPGTFSPSSGDLVIDIDSDNELNTKVSRRATKRPRYSSVTSDSSSDEGQTVSAFDRVRSLCVDEKPEGLPNFVDCQTGDFEMLSNTTKPSDINDHSPAPNDQSISTQVLTTVASEDVGFQGKKTTGKIREKERETSVKKEESINERKRKESIDDESGNRKRPKRSQMDKQSTRPQQHSYTGRITRSMSLSDVESPHRNNHQRRQQPPAKETVVRVEKEVENTPSLLAMVSDDTVDVTVAQQELSDIRKNHKRGGKKKKKKKPTEWYLRQKKEREMYERRIKERKQQTQREPPSCLYYSGGKCAKGAMCQFKHEKTKELCRFYAMSSCDKFLDGMCPKLHDEFPCMFYHRGKCSNRGNTCKCSHAPLTDETREILEKYVASFEERRHLSKVCSVNTTTPDPAAATTQEKHEAPTFGNLTAPANIHTPEMKPSDGRCLKVSKPGLGLNSSLLAQPICKPAVEAPRVKRLCSLSSYKPQSLSSLASSVQKVENQQEKVSENASSTNKNFLPGIFKER